MRSKAADAAAGSRSATAKRIRHASIHANSRYIFFRDVYAKVERNVSDMVSNTNLEEGDYVQLTIHKIPELTTRWQIVLDGVDYEITGIDPVSRISPVCVLSLHSIK